MSHYLHFYELAKAPFSPSADLEFRYWSPARQELRQTLVRAIAERKGLMMLTGADGIGKTTLLHAVLERAALQPLKVIFASLGASSPLSLLTTLVHELEQDTTREDAATPHQQLVLETYATGAEGTTLFRYLSTLLMEEYRRGVNVVLVIDDAHTSSAQSLLRLCHLTKLRVEGKALVQIILTGRPALDKMIDTFWLWRVRRQLAVRASVAPLATNESQAYLHHRLAAAAYGKTPVLWPEGIALLAKHGQGNPRLLNMRGHDVLSAGLAAEQRPISTDIVRSMLSGSAQKSQEHTFFSRTLPLMKKAAGLAVVVGGMTTLSLSGASYLRSESSPTVVSSATVKLADVNSFDADTTQKEAMSEAATSQSIVVRGAEPPPPPTMEKTDSGGRAADTRKPQRTQGKSMVTAKQPGAPLSHPSARALTAASRQEQTNAAQPLMQKSKSSTLATGEKVTKVATPHVATSHVAKSHVVNPHAAGAKASPPPQQRAAVKRPSPSRKNLRQPRVVSPVPTKPPAPKTKNDRLFDE